MSTTAYFLEFVAHRMHVDFVFKADRNIATSPAGLHFLLVFTAVSELEWLRLRFDEGKTDTLYPDFVLPPFPRSIAFVTQNIRVGFPAGLSGICRHLLIDTVSFVVYAFSISEMYRAMGLILGSEGTLHADATTPKHDQVDFWKFLWVWPTLLEVPLLRPGRLLVGLALAWVTDISRPWVDRWTGWIDLDVVLGLN